MAPVFSSPSFALCNNAVLNLMIFYASLNNKSYNSYEHDRIIALIPYYVNRNYKISHADNKKMPVVGSLLTINWCFFVIYMAHAIPRAVLAARGGMAYFIIPSGIHGTCHFSGSFPIRFHSFLICNFLIQHLPHIEITYYLHSKGYDPGRRI